MDSQDRPDLEALLAAARQGEPLERERLFEACRAYLGQVAQRQLDTWLQPKVDASDLVQLTLLEAHRDLDQFQGTSEGELLAWLRKMLAHNAGDAARRYGGVAKRKASREIQLKGPGDESSADMVGEPPANDATPSQQVMLRDEESRLREALDALSPDYREVIELRNFQRLPFADVAQRMGRSRPATQMLWARAINRLEEIMR